MFGIPVHAESTTRVLPKEPYDISSYINSIQSSNPVLLWLDFYFFHADKATATVTSFMNTYKVQRLFSSPLADATNLEDVWIWMCLKGTGRRQSEKFEDGNGRESL